MRKKKPTGLLEQLKQIRDRSLAEAEQAEKEAEEKRKAKEAKEKAAASLAAKKRVDDIFASIPNLLRKAAEDAGKDKGKTVFVKIKVVDDRFGRTVENTAFLEALVERLPSYCIGGVRMDLVREEFPLPSKGYCEIEYPTNDTYCIFYIKADVNLG
jgi:hypothetical protein